MSISLLVCLVGISVYAKLNLCWTGKFKNELFVVGLWNVILLVDADVQNCSSTIIFNYAGLLNLSIFLHSSHCHVIFYFIGILLKTRITDLGSRFSITTI